MRIQGAIFDLDGTLLDTMYMWDTVGSDYVRSRGLTPRPDVDDIFKTITLRQAADFYQADYGITDPKEKIMADIAAMVRDFYLTKAQPKTGAAELLRFLYSRGVKMCIATATGRELVTAALRRCGMLQYFQAIYTCGEVGAGKDTPVIFEAALSGLGTPKAETWVFEDAPHAARTAHGAGFPLITVFDPSWADGPDVLPGLSTAYLPSLLEAPALFE